jgi:formylmethanofuran dehydrogenase subunit E
MGSELSEVLEPLTGSSSTRSGGPRGHHEEGLSATGQDRVPPTVEGTMTEKPITEEMVEQTLAFHGHMCPGLAIGIRAAELALREIGPHSQDEEVVAVVETDMCGVDAIQFLTGCTFGKGNLIHLDYGKSAFTFYRRSDGKALRVVARPGGAGPPDPEWQKLREKWGKETLTPEEQERFKLLHEARCRQILGTPIEQLFERAEPQMKLPRPARIMDSVPCEECGEFTAPAASGERRSAFLASRNSNTAERSAQRSRPRVLTVRSYSKGLGSQGR